MTWTLYKHVNVKGLYIDRKMVGILSIFVILGICLVIFLVIATNSLSGLRAYSTMQGYWTEARNDGLNELTLFLKTGDSEHLNRYHDATSLIRDVRELKNELDKETPDYSVAEEKLLAIHTNPRDIDKMIKVFERFHTFDHFSNAVEMWDSAINLIDQLDEIAGQLRNIESELSEQEVAVYLDRVHSIDNELREHKDIVSASLSEGTQILQLTIIWLSVMMGGILLLSGFMLSYRFLKRIKMWATIVEISEQRYKSLFEYNPNAVFSLTQAGQISSGNEAFIKLSGYSKEEIDMEHIEKLTAPGEKAQLRQNLKKAAEGIAQSFESSWKQKTGDIIPVQLTMLPIYVDENIEGIFLIAEDMSYQKYAEQEIKKQLEEKTLLLSEVHDRVKNNLALMSSMLQLQDQYIDDETARTYLKSTINRIHSMALVHEQLYRTETFATISMDEVVSELVKSTCKSFQDTRGQIHIHVNSDPLTLDIKNGITFGLLVNELVSHSCEHFLQNQESKNLWVNLQKQTDQAVLTIEDDRKEAEEKFDLNSPKHLGITLIRTLVKQLEGEINVQNSSGMKIQVTFPWNGKAA